jgi:hypothetical protein
MNKEKEKYRRAFGRQVAVELSEEALADIGGQGHKRPMAKSWSTCDGTRTHRADTGLDCTGQTDDYGGLPV